MIEYLGMDVYLFFLRYFQLFKRIFGWSILGHVRDGDFLQGRVGISMGSQTPFGNPIQGFSRPRCPKRAPIRSTGSPITVEKLPWTVSMKRAPMPWMA